MALESVSFGRVTAVTGKVKKINKLNVKMVPVVKQGRAKMYDVTEKYRYASMDGLIAQAVNKGEKAILCVTGDDVQKVNKKEKGWDVIDNILAQMSQYIDLNKESLNQAFNKIV